MQFNNRQFESGVKETMESIDKLNESLKFKDSAKGFEELNAAARKVNLDGISDAVETVKNKFSLMEMAAFSAINNIVSKAMDGGTRLAKSLSVDQVTAGFSKYEEKTAAIQTLVNSTGKSVEEINGYVDKLMWFSDETSYSMNQMLNSMSTMVSAGGDISKIQSLVLGVADAVAFAGKGANEFQRTISNLTQSYNSGYLNAQDWKSLQMAGTASKQLVEELIKAGEELGTIKKGEVTAANFYTSLKEKWADTAVMEKAFGKFSKLAEAAYAAVSAGEYETASEAIAALSKDFDYLEVRAFKAAQEAKSFTEAIAATKDAVSTGWSSTFEIIFGNYKEATELWTLLSNVLWDTFASGAERRNGILRFWKEFDGRQELLNGIANAFMGLRDIVYSVKDGFEEVFPKKTVEEAGKRLAELTKKFSAFTKKMQLTEGSLMNIKDFFSGIASVFKLVKTIATSLIKAVFPVVNPANKFLGIILNILGGIGRMLSLFADWVSESDVLAGILNGITKALSFVSEAILYLLVLLGKGLKALGSLFKTVKSFLKQLNILDKVKKVVSAIGTAVMILIAGIASLVNNIREFVEVLRSKEIVNEHDSIFIKVLFGIKKGFEAIVGAVILAKNGIVSFINTVRGMSILDFFKKIGEFFERIKTRVVDAFKSTALFDFFTKSREGSMSFADALNKLSDNIKQFIADITIGRILAIGFTLALLALAGTASRLGSSIAYMTDGIGGFFKGLKKYVTRANSKFMAFVYIGEAFGLIAASLYLLSKIPAEDLHNVAKEAIILIGSLTGMAVGAMVIFALLNKFLSFKTNMKALSIVLLGMSGALLAITLSLKVLSTVDDLGDLKSKIEAIIKIMAAMTVLSLIATNLGNLTKRAGGALRTVAVLLALSFSLKNIINALVELGDISKSTLTDNVEAMVPLMIALGALAAGLGQIRISSAAGLFLTLKILEKALPILQEIFKSLDTEMLKVKYDEVREAVGDMYKVLIGLVGIFTMFAAFGGKNIRRAGLGLIGVAVAIGILVGIAAYFKDLFVWDDGKVIGIFIVILAFLALFGLIMAKSAVIAPQIFRFGMTMLLLSGVIAILCKIGEQLTTKLKDYDFGQVLKGFAPIVAMFAMFSVLLGMSSKIDTNAFKSIRALMLGIIMVSGEMIVLSFMSWDEVARGVIGILAVAGSLTAVLWAFSKIRIDHMWKPIVQLMICVGAIGALAGMLVGLTKWADAGSLEEASKALARVSVALGVLTFILGATKRMTKYIKMKSMESVFSSLGVSLLAMGAVAGILVWLSHYDWEGINEVVKDIWIMMGSLGILVTLLGALALVPGLGTGMITGAGALAIVAVGLVAVAGAIWILAAAFEKLKSVFSKSGEESVNAYTKAVNEASSTSEEKGLNIAKGLAKGLSKGTATVRDSTKQMLNDGVLNPITTIMDIHSPSKKTFGLGNFIGIGMANGIAQSVAEVTNSVNDMGENGILKPLTEYKDKAAKTFSDIGSWFKNAGSTIKTWWDENKDKSVTEIGGELGDKLKEKFGNWKDNTFASIREGIFGIGDAFDFAGESGNSFDDMLTEYGLSADGASGATKEFEKVLEDLGGGFDDISSSAEKTKSVFETLKDTISGQMDIFSGFSKGQEISADQMLDNMKSQIFGISEWANNLSVLAARGLNEGMLKQLGDEGPQSYAKVAAFMQMTDEQLAEANSMFAMSLKLPGSTALQVESSYTYAGELAAKGFSNALDRYWGLMDPENLSAMTLEGIQAGIDANQPFVEKRMKQLSEATKKAASSNLSKSDGKEIGENFIKGLKEGLGSAEARKELEDSTTSLAKFVNNRFKMVEQIHSPSRVWKGYGEYLVEGLSGGLGETGSVESSISNITSIINDAISNAIAKIQAYLNGDMTLSPVITPVMDLSNIQNGANIINGLTGSSNIRVAANGFNNRMNNNDPFAMDRALDRIAARYSNDIVAAIQANNIPVNVNVALEGDASSVFKMVRSENSRFIRANGYNALV